MGTPSKPSFAQLLGLTTLCTLLVLGSAGPVVSATGSPVERPNVDQPQADAACEERGPIVVIGDEGPLGFTWTHPITGERRPGLASGVVGGSGTAEDPYVIEGWCIERGTPSLQAAPVFPPIDGITIRDTTAHLVIRDNTVTGWRYGIHLDQADNVVVEGNEITDPDSTGVQANGSEAITVQANAIHGGGTGISAGDARDLRILENTLTDNAYGITMQETSGVEILSNEIVTTFQAKQGIQPDTAANTLVEGNTIEGYHTGVYVVESHGITVRDNDLASFMRGVNLWFTDGGLIEGNHIDGPEGWGVILVDSNENTIRENIARGAEHGVDIRGSGDDNGNLVVDNIIEANAIGVAMGSTGAHTVRANTITGNDVGMSLSNAAGHTVEDNQVTANELGVRFVGSSAEATLRSNTIAGNTDGTGLLVDLGDGATVDVDARWNWWGCVDGPDDEACDDVVGDALYEPWLTSSS